jgi:hypothetical protein
VDPFSGLLEQHQTNANAMKTPKHREEKEKKFDPTKEKSKQNFFDVLTELIDTSIVFESKNLPPNYFKLFLSYCFFENQYLISCFFNVNLELLLKKTYC